jgi:hypothetical protein
MATYSELLRITWLVFWRGALIGSVLGAASGFVVGALLTFLGHPRWIPFLASSIGMLFTLFVGYPLGFGMALRKRFRGFRVQLVRDP